MESSEKITLPRDAEGREIPLDTKVLYNAKGEKLRVNRVEFDPFKQEWEFRLPGDLYCWIITCRSKDVYLVNPVPTDSWDKLLDDLDNAAKGGDNAECLYMRREDIEVGEQCSGCRLYNADDVFSDCSCLAYGDIADRIRKLRGED